MPGLYSGITDRIFADSFQRMAGIPTEKGASYIEISGFVIEGNSVQVNLDSALNQPGSCKNRQGKPIPAYNGEGIQMMGLSSLSSGHPHHMRILNNTIHNCCAAGISGIQSDFITISNNIIYNNGWFTLYGSSGIVLYQNWNFNSDTTNYRMMITNNRIFGNMNYVPWPGAPCAITDGNGIIVDDSKNTQNKSSLGSYTGRTYIANNLVYGNGGAGIHVYLSEHVRIINNTAYFNQQTPFIFNGEIDARSSNDIIIRNNIMEARAGKPINTNWNNKQIVHNYNLYYGGNGSFIKGPNILTADPKFRNPSTSISADFSLNQDSPANDNGSFLLAPANDFINTERPKGKGIDIGAYESDSKSGTPK